ncbi:type IV secretion system protein VirB3 [Ensifer sp. SL37]|uniref:type IV secretion system protein VirB3 n=1 Tax=Ensifer sp. SL37 TaxID=2995137 RepID=UPI002272C59C|nr:VirB3 family type IV secretion system protein [Ensifer sp. SL37]MCY1741001.1 VirB3 family type IV secretion system protein [Ensifer sp. SL37]
MMVERDTIYMGLLRPAKLLGLPSMAALIWFVSGAVVFMWSESFWGLGTLVLTYPALYGLTLWDPHFFDVIAVTTKHFGVARNKALWQGYSYEP